MDYEAGPIALLDPARLPGRPFESSLESFAVDQVAGALSGDVPLGQARDVIAESLADRSIGDAYETDVAAAAREVDSQVESWQAVEPGDVIGRSESAGAAIDAAEREYPEPAAPEVGDYSAGEPPEDGGRPGEPPPPER